MSTDHAPQQRQTGHHRVVGLSHALGVALPDEDSTRVREAATRIDAVASGAAPAPGWERSVFPGWRSSSEGVRLMKRGVRAGLHSCGLPASGEAFLAAYLYVSRHY